MHPMMLCLLLASMPVVWLGEAGNVMPGLRGLAGLGPPVLYAVAQINAYPRGIKRALWFPALMLLGVGIALNNTRAVLEALSGHRPTEFLRTPKTDAGRGPDGRAYALSTDWSTWVEFVLAGYALAATALALQRLPGLAPFLLLFALGFLIVAVMSLLESRQTAAAAQFRLPARELAGPGPTRVHK
jgi:hypothetical protein